MSKLTVVDVGVLAVLIFLVPVLVQKYIKREYVGAGAQFQMVVGGLLWLLFSFFAGDFSKDALGVEMYDALGHEAWAAIVVRDMATDNWNAVWEHFRVGNHAYQCWVALLMWIGASVYTATMINAVLCFWGGLILAQSFTAVCPHWQSNRFWLLFTVFFPSVVFWGTMNLKEGFMYWSICVVLSAAFRDPNETFFLKSPLVLIALAVGALLRPHVMMGWAVAVAGAAILQGGRRGWAALILFILPLLFFSMRYQTGVGLSTESAMDLIETHYENLSRIGHQGSHIDHYGGKPILFVSGFVSAFLRPFPWTVGSLRILVSCVETWSMTLILLTVWVKYGSPYGRLALQLPAVRASILAVIWLCILLSYFPNEGLVVRQRVQMIPGLLTLAIVPIFIRETIRQRFAFQQQVLGHAYQVE